MVDILAFSLESLPRRMDPSSYIPGRVENVLEFGLKLNVSRIHHYRFAATPATCLRGRRKAAEVSGLFSYPRNTLRVRAVPSRVRTGLFRGAAQCAEGSGGA